MSGFDSHPSIVTGRRQATALRLVASVSWLMGGLGMLRDSGWSRLAGMSAITLVTATPLFRVIWLTLRWRQEGDWRFVLIGFWLLSVVSCGALLAMTGWVS